MASKDAYRLSAASNGNVTGVVLKDAIYAKLDTNLCVAIKFKMQQQVFVPVATVGALQKCIPTEPATEAHMPAARSGLTFAAASLLDIFEAWSDDAANADVVFERSVSGQPLKMMTWALQVQSLQAIPMLHGGAYTLIAYGLLDGKPVIATLDSPPPEFLDWLAHRK